MKQTGNYNCVRSIKIHHCKRLLCKDDKFTVEICIFSRENITLNGKLYKLSYTELINVKNIYIHS